MIHRQYAPTVNLGPMVKVRLGQSALIRPNRQGRTQVYFHANGAPGVFSVLDGESGAPVFSQEIPDSTAIWAMTQGTDGNIYLGNTNDGKLWRYLTEEHRLEELGSIPLDTWIWDLEASPDGKIYGCTYPSAGLFEYDIRQASFRSLGRISRQQYGRGLAVDGDYVYAGFGTVAELWRVNRHSGEKEELHIQGYSGREGFFEKPFVRNGRLMLAHGTSCILVIDADSLEILNTFSCDNFISEPSPEKADLIYYKYRDKLYAYSFAENKTEEIRGLPQLPATTRIKDMHWIDGPSGGKVLAIINPYGQYMIYDPARGTLDYRPLDIGETAVDIQSLACGPDGLFYMGGYQRGLTVYNPRTGETEASLPHFAQPEGIGFLGDTAWLGTYVSAVMYSYRHGEPLEDGTNPRLEYTVRQQDRPFAITSGDGKLFVGTVPDYGALGGSLAIFDEAAGSWQQVDQVVEQQSIIGLAYRDGLLYGSTSIWGGLGIEPAAQEAKLFVWDVAAGRKAAEFTPEIPGLDRTPLMIGDLAFDSTGMLWGAIEGTIFCMDPETFEVTASRLFFPSTYTSSKWAPYRLRFGADGLIYTTMARKVLAVDPQTLEYQVLHEGPVNQMELGADGSIYWAVKHELFCLPVR